MIDMFDNGNNEINKMFEQIGNSLDILDIPKYENDKTNEKYDAEKLNLILAQLDSSSISATLSGKFAT